MTLRKRLLALTAATVALTLPLAAHGGLVGARRCGGVGLSCELLLRGWACVCAVGMPVVVQVVVRC
ncbi:hypothetical protein AB4142_29820, partial [Variovorax sp. 2RAF20]